MPSGSRPSAPARSRTSASPAMAAAAPATVSGRGRSPCTTHIHATTSRIPEYSRSRATPIGTCWIALKNASWAPATARTPNGPMVPSERRRLRHRPRIAHTVGTARIRPAMPTRAATAVSAVQPALISDRAKVPDVPKVAADSTAIPRPIPIERSERTASSDCNNQTGGTLMTVAWRPTGVNMLFAHDTEVALIAAAALVNTDDRDGERLPDTAALAEFFTAHRWTGRREGTVEELQAVRDLRPRLRRIWEADEDE